MKQKHLFLLLLFMLMGGVSSWGEDVNYPISSSESAYTDQANGTTNFNGASQTQLSVYYTQYRDWGSSDGTVKVNAGGKIVFYKFPLSTIKSAAGDFKSATFKVNGKSSDASKNADLQRFLGYNAEWDASTITNNNVSNNSGTITGLVTSTGSFQPLNDRGTYSVAPKGTDLSINATTYVGSAISEGKDYVTIAIVANTVRTSYYDINATLDIVYSVTPKVDYTINYIFEGNTIKSENGNIEVGETVNAESPITIEGQKYYATSTTSMTIDEDAAKNVLNVELRKAIIYTYSVKNSFDEVLLTATEGIEGETYSVAYPKYILKGTDLYLAENSTGERSFSKYITLTGNTVATVTYTKKLENVVYFSEAENVEGATVYNWCSNTSTFASGDLAVFSNLAHLTTLPAGFYKIYARTLGRTDRYFDFYNGNGEDKVSLFHPGSAGFYNCGEQASGTIILNSSTDIYFQGGYGTTSNNGNVVDLFYIQKLGDVFTANTDATFLINNPTIDGSNGWTCERPNGGNGPLLNNNSFEFWCDNNNNSSVRENGSFDYYQTLYNLPNGYYTVSAEMYNSLNGEAGAVFNESCGVYGNDVMAYVTAEGNTLNRYTTNPILVTDGTLRIGVKSDKRMGARWFVADNFRLTYLGDAIANMAITEGKYGTFCAPFDVTLPAGVVASQVNMNAGNASVQLTELNLTDGVLPAGTAVLVNTESGSLNKTFYGKATTDAATCTTGSLVGILTEAGKQIPVGAYILQAKSDGIQKFYKVATAGPGALNRCYLVANSEARVISLDGNETAIESIKTDADETIYDLAGRKVMKAQKGLYIVNGKKVIR